MAIKLSLVIPTYNEAANISCLCQRIIDCLSRLPIDFEIIIVDDDSPDLTWKVAEGLSGRWAKIKVIRRMHSRGLAQAVVEGWMVAQGEILGVLDADLQHPPEILFEMINQLMDQAGVDIVIASRYVPGGGSLSLSLGQALRSRLAIFSGFIFFPRIFKLVKDPMSGYFILRKEVITGKFLKPLGYKILLEVLAAGNYRKVLEVPFVFAARQSGQTKASLKQCLLSLLHLVRLKSRKISSVLMLR